MADYERYHGLVLRALITELSTGTHIKAEDAHGVVNSFVIGGKVGLYIKHSTKRMSPWTFGFTEDHMAELALLSDCTTENFVCLVCGYDGFLTLNMAEVRQLMDTKSSDRSLSIHVKRRKHHNYAVGGRSKLERTKPQGFPTEMLQAITN